jgi:hypothetical protein
VLYTCVLWKLFLEIVFYSVSSLFQIFCVKRTNDVLGRPDDDSDCPDGISDVQTKRLIRPDVYSSCSDDRVFVTSTWHYVQKSLKFRPDGEPCRVKSLSPHAQLTFWPPFVFVCRLVRFSSTFYI